MDFKFSSRHIERKPEYIVHCPPCLNRCIWQGQCMSSGWTNWWARNDSENWQEATSLTPNTRYCLELLWGKKREEVKKRSIMSTGEETPWSLNYSICLDSEACFKKSPLHKWKVQVSTLILLNVLSNSPPIPSLFLFFPLLILLPCTFPIPFVFSLLITHYFPFPPPFFFFLLSGKLILHFIVGWEISPIAERFIDIN